MKNIRFTRHALEQCVERGTNEIEVREAIQTGRREPAKLERFMYRANFEYNATWYGRFYRIKQVAPVVAETETEILVITVYLSFARRHPL